MHTGRFSTARAGEELIMVHRLAMIPVSDLVGSLDDAGFEQMASYRSWASTEPGPPDGPRIIAVGGRPACRLARPGAWPRHRRLLDW